MSQLTIHVLLVDRDEQDFMTMRDLLAGQGGPAFDVTWCADLACTLERLQEGMVDVILLDAMLPDSRGDATFDAIRAKAPSVPVVYLAPADDATEGLQAIKRGAQDFLPKGGTDRDQLVRSIRYAIARKRVEMELWNYQTHLQDMVDAATGDLLTANARLQSEVKQRAAVEAELRAAVAKLERHNESKNEFVSNVSHELRTPLASIGHALENLRRGVRGPIEAPVMSYVTMMEEDCRRLTGTVSDLLDLNRIEAGRLVLNRRKLHLGRFAERTAAGLRLQAERRHQRLNVQGNGSLAFVLADPARMDRVIHNLVGNALKFTPEGGQIDVFVRADAAAGGAVLLDVRDDGVGIEPQHLPRVTERYYRVGEHVTGAGLGLALCREMVDLHGGSMALTSPPPGAEHGTLVTVRLPAADPPRVLAVDDDEQVLTLLCRQLSGFGYRPIGVADGPAALAALGIGSAPDIIIMDVRLPGMSGVELVARIKADARLQNVPVLMLTGYDLDADQQAFLGGFDVQVMRKPWARQELLHQLEQLTVGPVQLHAW